VLDDDDKNLKKSSFDPVKSSCHDEDATNLKKFTLGSFPKEPPAERCTVACRRVAGISISEVAHTPCEGGTLRSINPVR
jgi:hypothetical protein